MGYFNYFIKCVIRRFVYFIFKPKVAFTILLSFCIFLGMKYYGYCAEWTDQDIASVLDGFATITNNQGVIITQLGNIGVDVSDLQNTLNSIKSDISLIETNTSNIATTVANIYLRLNTLNNSILSLMNTVNSNHEELVNQLKQDNEKVLNELEEIKKILIGASEETTEMFLKQDNSFWYLPNPNGSSVVTKIYSSNPGNGRNLVGSHFKYNSNDLDFIFEKGYTYTVTLQIRNSVSGGGRFYYTYDNLSVGNEIKVNYLGNFTQSSFSFTITPIRDGTISLLAENFAPFWKNQAFYTISKVPNGSLSSIGNNLNNVQGAINQQGENINNSINNSDVNVDSSLPTNDTNDITLDGFNSIFNTLYSSFTGTSSDVILPIPFTNKSITINYQNVFGNFSFGVLSSIISGFWYFIICLFIVNDIKNKINSIKAGNIENVQSTNIKGDLL